MLIASVGDVLVETYAALVAVEAEAAEVSSDAVECVARQRQNIESLDSVAQSSIRQYGHFTDAGDVEAAHHEYRKLLIVRKKVPQMGKQAAACLAPDEPSHCPRQPVLTDPDPTDVPDYYQLDEQGWVEGFSIGGQ